MPALLKARTADEPLCRLFARLTLAGLPRGGGNGDDIRCAGGWALFCSFIWCLPAVPVQACKPERAAGGGNEHSGVLSSLRNPGA